MEAAGLALGAVGLAGQLLTASLSGYGVLTTAQNVGDDFGKFTWRLAIEQHRLTKWGEVYKLSDPEYRQAMEIEEETLKHVVVTLARLVMVLLDVDKLRNCYGIGEASGGKRRAIKGFFRRKKPSATTIPLVPLASASASTPAPNSPAADPGLQQLQDNIQVLESSTFLQSDLKKLSDVALEMGRLEATAAALQGATPGLTRIRWAVVDKTKSEQLLEDVKEYNDALYKLLPVVNGEGVVTLRKKEPPKHFSIPYGRNPGFVGREDELKKLHNLLNKETAFPNRVGVYGLGGVGKTQLVAEYAHQHRYSYHSIFWVRAVRSTTLRSTYADIAKRIGLVTSIDGEAEVEEAIKKAKTWLESPESGNWLLIFDNGDDIFDGASQDSHGNSLLKQIHLMMPTRGKSILTTRDRRAIGTSIARYPLELTCMQEPEAMELFMDRAFGPDHFETPAETQAARELVDILGLLPLAIDQAAGYIHTLQMPLREYIQKIEEPSGVLSSADTNDHELLNYSSSVMRTWEVSLEYIDRQLPLAGKLLRVMGFLDNECIFEDVLDAGFCSSKTGTGPPPILKPLIGDFVKKDDYLQALGALNSLSLIRRFAQNDGYESSVDYPALWVHRLVHMWLKERMSPQEKSVWIVGAVELLGHAADTSFFPTSNAEYTYQLLLKNWNLFTGEDSIISHRTITVLIGAGRQVPLDLGSINDLLGKLDFFISKVDRKDRIKGLAALVMLKLYTLDFTYMGSVERHGDFWATIVPHLGSAAHAIDWGALNGNTGISCELVTNVASIFPNTDYEHLSKELWWHYIYALRKPTSFISKNYSLMSASFHAEFGLTLLNDHSEPGHAAYCFHQAIQLYLAAGKSRTYDLVKESLDGLLDCFTRLDQHLRIERVLINDFSLLQMIPSGFTTSGFVNKYLSRLQLAMLASQRKSQYLTYLARFCEDVTTPADKGMEHMVAANLRRRRLKLFSLLAAQGGKESSAFAARLLANNIERCVAWAPCEECTVFTMDGWRELMYSLCACLADADLGGSHEIANCRRALADRLDGKCKHVHRGDDGWKYHDEALDEYYSFDWDGDQGARLREEILATLVTTMAELKSSNSRMRLRREIRELAEVKFRRVYEPWGIEEPLEKDLVFWGQLERELWKENAPPIPVLDADGLVDLEGKLIDISRQLTEDIDAEELLRQNTR